MKEKRLTDQQQRRIAVSKAAFFDDDAKLGVVAAHHSQRWQVHTASGQTIACTARKNLGKLVVGDEVLWQNLVDPVIEKRLERKSVLARNPQKPMAANIDQVVVVISTLPAPIEYYMDQLLVAAETQQMPPIIVLNKTDLPELNDDSIQQLIRLYESIGYPVLQTSIEDTASLERLRQALQNHTSILVGASGVGKSSLLNTLLGDQYARVSEISSANQRGRHTTTTAQLYFLNEQSRIIDSPGLREFGIWESNADVILSGFKEIKPLLGQCQFRNCAHGQDAGCAIQATLADGNISASRWQSFLRMVSA